MGTKHLIESSLVNGKWALIVRKRSRKFVKLWSSLFSVVWRILTWLVVCTRAWVSLQPGMAERGHQDTLHRTKYTYIPRVPQCLSPRPNWDPPPLPLVSVLSPPEPKGGYILANGWGGGGVPIRTTSEKKPSTLSTLCPAYNEDESETKWQGRLCFRIRLVKGVSAESPSFCCRLV